MTSLTVMLAACGGGGDAGVSEGENGGSKWNPPVTPIPISQPSDLQLTVPTPTYAENSDNLATFNAINQFRSSLGLGLLAQNTKLDAAAMNHVDYEVLHHVFGHDEIRGYAGFTGVDATERAAYAGYMARWVGDLGAGVGKAGVAAFINSVYHRGSLMNQQISEVGIANAADSTVQFISVSDALRTQRNAPDFIAVYPLDGQTALPLAMGNETPKPFPSITLPSSPISFVSAHGTTLKVTRFTVTAQGDAAPLTTQLITKESDPNVIYLSSNEAYIAGVDPFLPNTVYNVSFVGKVDNLDVSKTWSFTTADH